MNQQDFFVKTGRRTKTSDRPSDTTIIVQDPSDGITEPMVEFLDNIRPNRVNPTNPDILPPPDFSR